MSIAFRKRFDRGIHRVKVPIVQPALLFSRHYPSDVPVVHAVSISTRAISTFYCISCLSGRMTQLTYGMYASMALEGPLEATEELNTVTESAVRNAKRFHEKLSARVQNTRLQRVERWATRHGSATRVVSGVRLVPTFFIVHGVVMMLSLDLRA